MGDEKRDETGYVLKPELDIDLRDPAVRALHKVPDGWGEAASARALAVERINHWLKAFRQRDLHFELGEFDITLEIRSVLTGKGNTPVEWQARKAARYQGERGEWVAQIDFDDPPGDRFAAALKVPHVGYGVAFLEQGGSKAIIERTGHIIVSKNALEACRPHPRHRAWFQVRTRRP